MEYLTVKFVLNKTSSAAVLLSEFAGCTKAIGGTVKVNPFDVEAVASQIEEALTQPKEDRIERFASTSRYLKNSSCFRWAFSFLRDVKAAHEPAGEVMYTGIGLGLNKRIIDTKRGVNELRIGDLDRDYTAAKQRLIIIDHEGTLPSKFLEESLNTADEAIASIDGICRDERNRVFLISSERREQVEEQFGSIPNIGVACENGYEYMFSQGGKGEGAWVKLVHLQNVAWKERAMDIMNIYTERTDGSHIEMRESYIKWNFKNTDVELGT